MRPPRLQRRLDAEAAGLAAGEPEPIQVVEVELGEQLQPIARRERGGRAYARARLLVRLHGHPLGVVDLPLAAGGLSAAEWAPRVRDALSDEIAGHLDGDGLPPIPALPPAGMASRATPACLERRLAVRASAPRVSVIVATRERPQALARCLASLRRVDHADFEIVVVDNAPTTSATEVLVASRFPGVRYVREDRRGLAAAHNRGLAEATGSIVAFTDDDVAVDPLWLLELTAGFSRHPRVGCVTGLILAAELETPAQVWADRHWGLAKGFRERMFTHPLHRLSWAPYPYTAGVFGSGANMAFRTELLRELGAFDVRIGTGTPAQGGDDLAAFFAVIAAGRWIVYTPAALVWHSYAADLDSLRRQAYGYGSGLTAYLAKILAEDPTRALDVALRAPAALAHLRGRAAVREADADARPRELVRLERRGMARGPLGYLRGSRRRDASGVAR